MAVEASVDFVYPRLPERWIAAAFDGLPTLAAAIVAQIRDEVVEYRDDPEGVVQANVRAAVESALQAFVNGLVGRDAGQYLTIFRRLGRLEVEAGRSHDTLQMAYRVATLQVAEFLAQVARKSDASPVHQAEVRHAAIAFIEQLASLSRAGYEDAETTDAAETVVVTRLLELMVSAEGSSRSRIAALAEQVGWPAPDRVRAVELVPEALFRSRTLSRLRRRGGTAVVVGRLPDRCVGFVDADADVSFLTDVIPRTATAVLGPPVHLLSAAVSARLANRRAHRAGNPARGIVRFDDQLLELFGREADDVLVALSQTHLQPLESLGIVRRLKAARVLSAMLEYGGLPREAPEFAEVSPSTLQYRRAVVEDLFGDVLRDRNRRVELLLALRRTLPQWELELTMHERRYRAGRKR